MQNPPERPPIPKPPKPPKYFPGLKNKSDTVSPEVSKKPSVNKLKTTANMMMALGFIMMTFTLIGYETSICTYKENYLGNLESDCTYNIGKIGNKNNLIMFSGFLFLGGCILLNNEECRK
ncbi:hypothetical protein [Planktothrix agardhii]|jgi:hypothetical protein|uniref:hypothetical protein n=1 Tax=Planktothrix agardhii TaxID=1160 RepID=UPI0020A735A9|nr:hypothetical protein [Planktothrix agardhii]